MVDGRGLAIIVHCFIQQLPIKSLLSFYEWMSALFLDGSIRRKINILITSIQHGTRHSSQCDKAGKRNKRYRIVEKEIKLSFFTDDIIMNTENPEDSNDKLLNLIRI